MDLRMFVKQGIIAGAIMVLHILGGIAILLTPGFLVAGVMGLAREGHRGRFFFIEQAFYWSMMLYPLVYGACILVALVLVKQSHFRVALLVSILPFLIPGLLLLLVIVTGGM
jgi:hypothetical protein